MKNLWLAVFFCFLLAGQAWGATETFYVCHGGDGSLPETNACGTAWDEADFNNADNWDTDDQDDGKIGPNDEVLFLDDGGSFTADQLTIQSSGLSGKPITIKAASGDSPIIDLDDSAKLGLRATEKDYLTIEDLEVRDCYGIRFSDCEHVTVDGVTTDNTYMAIMFQDGGGNNTVQNCTVQDNVNNTGASGIVFYGSATNALHDCSILDNTIEKEDAAESCHADGISVHRDASLNDVGSNFTISGNTVSYCGGDNFDLTSGDYLTVENNISHHPGTGWNYITYHGTKHIIFRYNYTSEGQGIYIGGTSCEADIYYNVIDTAGDKKALLVYQGDDHEIYNNVFICAKTESDECVRHIGAATVSVIFKNNIIYNETGNGILFKMSETDPDTCSWVSSNNCWYHSSGSSAELFSVDDGGDTTMTLATLASTYAGVSDTLFDNPDMSDVSSNDFQLTAQSPCIDAGTDVSLTPCSITSGGTISATTTNDGLPDMGFEFVKSGGK